jgi:hypothetical protein
VRCSEVHTIQDLPVSPARREAAGGVLRLKPSHILTEGKLLSSPVWGNWLSIRGAPSNIPCTRERGPIADTNPNIGQDVFPSYGKTRAVVQLSDVLHEALALHWCLPDSTDSIARKLGGPDKAGPRIEPCYLAVLLHSTCYRLYRSEHAFSRKAAAME